MDNSSDSPCSHHSIKFFDVINGPPRLAGQSSASRSEAKLKKLLQSTREAIEIAGVLNRQLKMPGRVAVVRCVSNPGFFAIDPAIVQCRSEFLRAVTNLTYLRFIIPLGELDGIHEALPDDWGESGQDNICLMLRVDSADEATLGGIDKFKEIPSPNKMLNVGPEALALNLAGNLDGFQWVVADGGPLPTDPADGDPALECSRALRDECVEKGIAFLYHRDGEVVELDGETWWESPFGDKVNLAKPPMPGSKRSATLAEITVPAVTPAVAVGADASAGLVDVPGRLAMPPAAPSLKPRKAWSPHTAVQHAEAPVVVEAVTAAVTNHNASPPDLQTPVAGHPSDSVNDGDDEAGDQPCDEPGDDADEAAEDDGDSEHEADGDADADAEDGADGGEADAEADDQTGDDTGGEADEPMGMSMDECTDEETKDSPAMVSQSPNETSADHVSAPPEPAARPLKPRKPRSSRTAVQQAEAPVVVLAEVVTNDSAAPIGHNPETPAVGHASGHDLIEFQRLDAIVRRGWDMFVDWGVALKEIRDRELWKAGGHASWNAYCQDVAGMSRSYANRQIRSAGVTKAIAEVVPIGTTQRVLPRAESQVRPLLRIKDDNLIPELWDRAVTREGGKQPTAETVKQIVAEALEEQDKPTAPAAAPTQHREAKAQRRGNLIARLEDAVRARDWDEVELAVVELKQWF